MSDSTVSSPPPTTGLELRSTLSDDGTATLALHEYDVAPPGDDEVVVRIEAAPINPSDLGMLFAMGDVASAVAEQARQRVVQQAATSVLAQANASGSLALQLL